LVLSVNDKSICTIGDEMKKPTTLFKQLNKEIKEAQKKKKHYDIIYTLVDAKSTIQDIIDIYDKG